MAYLMKTGIKGSVLNYPHIGSPNQTTHLKRNSLRLFTSVSLNCHHSHYACAGASDGMWLSHITGSRMM